MNVLIVYAHPEPTSFNAALRDAAQATLDNLEKWMDKAEEHAKAKSFEIDVLAHARLAPDQYDFVRQVQSGCDQAKYAAAYLGAKQPPSHPDTEESFAELRERVRKCTSFLATIQEKDYAGAEQRIEELPRALRRQRPDLDLGVVALASPRVAVLRAIVDEQQEPGRGQALDQAVK